MDRRREWLKEEIRTWEEEGLLTEEAAARLLARYRNDGQEFAWSIPLFAAAVLSVLAGLFFLAAGFWNELSQDGRFYLAVTPVVLSLLLAAASIAAGGRTETAGGRATALFWLREGAGIFHGLSVTAALWLVHDSFMLSSDVYPLAGIAAGTLLVMLYLIRSAGLGVIFAANAAWLAWSAPVPGWPDAAAWLLLAAGLPFFFLLVRKNQRVGGILYAWAWMSSVLLLTVFTASGEMWQVLFFSAAASLTWLLGAALRPTGWAGTALRGFGGAAVYAGLLLSSFGTVWQAADGSWLMWLLLLVFLGADGLLLWKAAGRKEWLSLLVGLTPFVLAASGLLALWDRSGASSAVLASGFLLLLAGALAARGIQTGRGWQTAAGFLLLAGGGAVRLGDAALTFGQRGAFFLAAGVCGMLLSGLVYLAFRRRPARANVLPLETENGEARDE